MKLVDSSIYCIVDDIKEISFILNKIADEMEHEGHIVRRGLAGAVTLELENGEVRYIPSYTSSGFGIKKLIFHKA